MRVGCYIDGFNLYHAVNELGRPMLKWTNLRAVAQSFCRPDDELVRVVFYTAINRWNPEKRKRHLNFKTALEATGVEVRLSTFDKVDKYCKRHRRYCPFNEEKQTDVALSVDVLTDCYEDVVERIILVTADSDHLPTVRRIREKFPHKVVFLVAPPKRLQYARELGNACNGITELTAGRIADHPFPIDILDHRGKKVATCPANYGPRPR
jgi:uncharacterized LabA/DUF88 family protein